MKKSLMLTLSAVVLASSLFTTVSAKTNFTHNTTTTTISADAKNIQDQLKTNKKSQSDLLKQVKQSDAYKALEAKQIELQKAALDQQVKDGKITQVQADAAKAKIDAKGKIASDTELQKLEETAKATLKSIEDLKTKYTTVANLVASDEFKTLKTTAVTTANAIVDRLVADGALTSDEATKIKANITQFSTDADNGKLNIKNLNGLTGAFGEKGHQEFNGVEEFDSKNFDKDEKGFDGEKDFRGGKGFKGGKFGNKDVNKDSTNTTNTTTTK